MEVEVHWEIPSILNEQDNQKLIRIINEIQSLELKCAFLQNRNLAHPLHLNIIIIDDTQMKNLNFTYRKKNKTTDVLTFPFALENEFHGGINYGEIYISQETANKQCQGQNLTLFEELVILIVHGFLHAFHYDHEESGPAEKEMSQFEREILILLGSGHINPLIN